MHSNIFCKEICGFQYITVSFFISCINLINKLCVCSHVHQLRNAKHLASHSCDSVYSKMNEGVPSTDLCTLPLAPPELFYGVEHDYPFGLFGLQTKE